MISSRTVRFAAAFALALGAAACAKDTTATSGVGGGIATPGSAQDFVVNVGDRVFFETDSDGPDRDRHRRRSTSRPPGCSAIRDYTFLVEGHADERGTREYNFSLSARRAQTVRDYLISRGIPGNRIRTVSYGKERPVAVCNDISCWSQNRRAVTVLDGAGGV